MVIGEVQDIGLVFTELLLAGRDPKIADRFVRSRGGLFTIFPKFDKNRMSGFIVYVRLLEYQCLP
jgi:hypothetical protein